MPRLCSNYLLAILLPIFFLTRKAVSDRKPPPTPCCSPGGITIFGSGFPYLPMVKKSENQNPGFLSDHFQN